MTRALCKGCAEIYGRRFNLHAELKKEVKKCSCDICREQGSCMIYTVKRKEDPRGKNENGAGGV